MCSNVHHVIYLNFLIQLNFLKARQYIFYVLYILQNKSAYAYSKHLLSVPYKCPSHPNKGKGFRSRFLDSTLKDHLLKQNW